MSVGEEIVKTTINFDNIVNYQLNDVFAIQKSTIQKRKKRMECKLVRMKDKDVTNNINA